jgi:hypothetical protein
MGELFLALLPFGLFGCSHMMKSKETCDDCVTMIHSSQERSLEGIAKDIDALERHIDWYGSVTAKHPDIWGQARLTAYRQEFERAFAADKSFATMDNFRQFQGALARSDQSFLASAFALNLAITGREAGLIPPEPIQVQTITSTQTQSRDADTTGDKKAKSVEEKIPADPTSETSTPKTKEKENTLTVTDDGKIVVKDNTSTTRESKTKDVSPVPIPTSATIPTDLVTNTTSQINRTNVAFQQALPGFGTNGLTLEPSVILDQKKRFLDHLNQIRRVNEGDDNSDSPGYALYLMRVPVSVLPGKKTDIGYGAEIMMSVNPVLGDDLLPLTYRNLVINDMVDQFSELLTALVNTAREEGLDVDEIIKQKPVKGEANALRPTLKSASKKLRPRSPAPAPFRTSEFAFPMDHVEVLFGDEFTNPMVETVLFKFNEEIKGKRVVHLHDVRSFVREQIVAAYRLLTSGQPDSWHRFCTPELAKAVRDVDGDGGLNPSSPISVIRAEFNLAMGSQRPNFVNDPKRDLLEALAWGLLMDAAVLNELLVRDIKETATNRGYAPPALAWLDYFHPNPSSQARTAFNTYVEQRWPIYTFAVDPVLEQQNIQDTFSQRREMQLSLALAFSSGRMNAQQFTRFSRRLEADYQTIDLNRTVVGFSHGDNTFGWRFYPRFQTPDIPGNLEVITRDLIGGSMTRNQDLKERRLEPGQRECVALIVMPSFVPYATLNISSNWFELTNPKHKKFSTQEAIKLGTVVRSIESCSDINTNTGRHGDLGRLLAKTKQLAARLPLQDMNFQIPYQNTLGGFEFFNSGITDLVPKLDGWYGAEGITPARETELFLMGDHFSVTNTQLVAGGVEIAITDRDLISRQVVRVKIPPNAVPTSDPDLKYSKSGSYVEIRLATSNGVSGRLRVPVIKDPPPATVPLLSSHQGAGVYRDRDTDLFLQGTNLASVKKVIAAGKDVSFEVIGPSVLKVAIPRDSKVLTSPDGKEWIDLQATGTDGVSNLYAVPVVKPTPAPMKDAPKEPTTLPTLTSNQFEIAFRYKNLGIEAVEVPNRRPNLRVKLNGLPRPTNTVRLTVACASPKLDDIVFDLRYDPKNDSTEEFSEKLMQELFTRTATQFGPSNTNPVRELKLNCTVTWQEGGKHSLAQELTTRWIEVLPLE